MGRKDSHTELSENERGTLAADKVVKCCISKDICHTNTESTDRQIYSKRSRCAPARAYVWAALCDGILKIPIRPFLASRVFLRVCIVSLQAEEASRTVTEQPWVGWLLSGLRRLITLSAQWWSRLEIIYDSSAVPLVLVSQVIIQRAPDWHIISDPHPSFGLFFLLFCS